MTTKVISAPRLSFLIQVADAASNTAGTSSATRSEMRDNAAALRELEKARALLRRWTNAAGRAEQEQGFTTTELHHCWHDSMALLAAK